MPTSRGFCTRDAPENTKPDATALVASASGATTNAARAAQPRFSPPPGPAVAIGWLRHLGGDQRLLGLRTWPAVGADGAAQPATED